MTRSHTLYKDMRELVYNVTLHVLCIGRKLRGTRRGRPALLASKVWRAIWNSPELREAFLDLCEQQGTSYSRCRDRGVFIVRNYILQIMRTDTPLASELRKIAVGLQPDLNGLCQSHG